MKKQIVLIFSLLLAFISIQAQSLVGKIKDIHQQPVPFANIIIMDTDSVFIAGDVSNDNGEFKLTHPGNAALLKVSYIGYQEKIVPINSGQTDMGDILLEEMAEILGEVVVKGNLPVTHIKGGALVTNVAGSILEKAGSAQDVLGRIPGILRKGDELSVFGRGTPRIYINGREMRDPLELSQLTSDNIKAVEVIANPGARYDKTVTAVIRIQTKKKIGDGFGFADRANVSYNDNVSFSDQLDLNYRQDKVELTGMLSYSEAKSWRYFDGLQKTFLDYNWEQQMHEKENSKRRNIIANMTLNYAVNPNHSLGASYRYNRVPMSGMNMNMHTDVFQNQSLFENSASTANLKNPSTRHEENIYYNGNIGEWSIDFNGTGVHNKEITTMFTHEDITDMQGSNKENIIHTNTDTRNRLYAGKLDVSGIVLGGDLSFGGEFSYTHRTDKYVNDEGIVDNDDSKIKEGMVAAFVEYGHEIGNLTLQAGLRLENINFNYYESGIFQEDQSRDYTNLFPSLSLTIPTGKVETQLSYTSGITRPSYFSLRNRVDYINRYTYQTGNPFLKSALTHTVALQSVYRWWQFYVDFERCKDAIVFASRTYSADDPTIALLSSANASPYNTMSVSVTASPKIGCWSPQFDVSLYKQWYTVEAPGTLNDRLSLNKPLYSVGWKNTIELPMGFMLSTDLEWQSNADVKNMSYKAVWWADASLYKSFLNNQLVLQVQANDLFNTYHNNYLAYFGRLRTLNMHEAFSMRSIGLTVQYKFNVTKSKYSGTGAGESQKERL